MACLMMKWGGGHLMLLLLLVRLMLLLMLMWLVWLVRLVRLMLLMVVVLPCGLLLPGTERSKVRAIGRRGPGGGAGRGIRGNTIDQRACRTGVGGHSIDRGVPALGVRVATRRGG